MSKQTPRQPSKRGQTANKQSNNLSSRQTVPTNKQTTNVPLKQGRPDNKQTANASVKRPGPANKPLTRQAMKLERREEEKRRRLEEQRRARRRKRVLLVSIVAVVLVASAITVYAVLNARKSTAQNPNALPTEQVFNPAYQPVDGIYCDQLEQTGYHIHAHLTIYINGQQVAIPQGVGIATDQSCLYWLHTHDSTGVIHIEAPQKAALTLENFLDIWGQQEFSQLGFHTQLAESAGWTIYVNGNKVTGDFNKVVFQPHMLITIAYNSPGVKPDTTYNWPPNL
jgi:hypothetical protein